MDPREERHDRKKNRDDANDAKLTSFVGYLKGTDRRLILQSENKGAWMDVHVTTVTGTLLSATESRDFLCTRYNITSPQPSDPLQRICHHLQGFSHTYL